MTAAFLCSEHFAWKVSMLVAWIGSAGGVFVYDGAFSAVRSADGNWRAPAPSGVNVRDLYADGYQMAPPAEAAALVKAARIAVGDSPVRAK